jgi:NAD(P)-dependent dehydrogenase (short-subunit alcohol dehydrogenase family)
MNPLKQAGALMAKPVGALSKVLSMPTSRTTPHGLVQLIRPSPSLETAIGGKVVLITGGSSGTGRAAAMQIAHAGGTVLLVARGEDKLKEAAAEIAADGVGMLARQRRCGKYSACYRECASASSGTSSTSPQPACKRGCLASVPTSRQRPHWTQSRDAFQAGNTAGTDALRDLGTVPRVIMQRVVMRCPMWDRFGISHPLEVGAKRLVDALVGGPLESGGFYAGAQQTLTGLLVNQAGIVADFGDDAVQDHAYGAIHAFLRTPSAEEAQP